MDSDRSDRQRANSWNPQATRISCVRRASDGVPLRGYYPGPGIVSMPIIKAAYRCAVCPSRSISRASNHRRKETFE